MERNIFVFSDWIKSAPKFVVNKIKELNIKPDALIYCGDNFDKFAPLPKSFLKQIYNDNISNIFEDINESNSNFRICKFKKNEYPQNIDNCYIFKFEKIKKKLSKVEILNLIYNNLNKIENEIKYEIGEDNFNKKNILNFLKKSLEFYKIENNILTGLLYLKKDKFDYLKLMTSELNCPLLYVLGNHENSIYKDLEFPNCVNLHKKSFKLNKINFIGHENIPKNRISILQNVYTEEDFENNILNKIKKNEKYILVTHCPPYKILDEEFIERKNIGSKGIRNVLEKKSSQILLHLFGHVESYCGKEEIFKKTICINAATNSSDFAKGIIYQIKISNKIDEIKLHKTNSNFENYIISLKKLNIDKIMKKFYLNKKEIEEIIRNYKIFGKEFIDDFEDIYFMKFEGSNPTLRQKIELYKIKKTNKEISFKEMEEIVKKTNSNGILKCIFYRAILNQMALKKKRIIIYNKSNILKINEYKRIYYDLEYDSSKGAYLFGFNINGKTKIFDIYQKEELKKFILEKLKKNYYFINYGGSDKKFLFETINLDKKKYKERFINFLYLMSMSIGLPIYNYTLNDVFNYISNNIINKRIRRESSLSKILITNINLNFGKIPEEKYINKGVISERIMSYFEENKDIRKLEEYKYMKKVNIKDIINLQIIVEKIIKKLEMNN